MAKTNNPSNLDSIGAAAADAVYKIKTVSMDYTVTATDATNTFISFPPSRLDSKAVYAIPTMVRIGATMYAFGYEQQNYLRIQEMTKEKTYKIEFLIICKP